MSVELWKSIFDWAAVIMAALTFVAGAGALITGNILSDRQDEQLKQFNKDLTDARERSAKLEVEALTLRKELISQGPRVNLLYGQTGEKFVAALKLFPKQKVEIRYSSLAFNQFHVDSDTMGVAMRLQYLLGQAGWEVEPLLRDNSTGTAVWVAVSSKAPVSTVNIANKLLDALRSVPLKVNDTPNISDAPRPPQVPIFTEGREVELRPLTPDTIVVTVLAHP